MIEFMLGALAILVFLRHRPGQGAPHVGRSIPSAAS
jgi:hypothetical protein